MTGKLCIMCFAALWLVSPRAEGQNIPGTGMLSGTVTASKPFRAARVHATNVDKNILYMVFTHNGHYRAVNMLPGNYEVTVRQTGFATDVKKVVVKTGEDTAVDFALREAEVKPIRPSGIMGMGGGEGDEPLVSYDTLYPPGPGRDALEKQCLYCHGPSYFPRHRMSEQEWRVRGLDDKINAGGPRGSMHSPAIISPSALGVHPRGELEVKMNDTLSENDKNLIAEYLGENFGPSSPKRALRMDFEIPIDENALANAMYIEYYLPLDPKLDPHGARRETQDPHIGNNGEVWYTDRSKNNRVGRLDPRTGEFKDFKTPDPNDVDPHGLTVDKQGEVWFAEEVSAKLGRLDPETGKMEEIDTNPDGSNSGGWINTPALDSKGNVWFTVILGNKLGKWDRETGKVTLYPGPTSGHPGYGYGIVVDQKDKVWFAEYQRCKVAKFDPETEKFTEYPALPGPDPQCVVRRLAVDSRGTIWYGVYSHGKLGKLVPSTGEQVLYDLPVPFSQPYGMWVDPFDDVWTGDGGIGDRGTFVKFSPQTRKFTYFPTPQIAAFPNIDITREGAIWYTPRTRGKVALGVLYPDVTKITTLGAYR